MFNDVMNPEIVKKHFGWKMAFCQHPMYLVVDEDRGVPALGERTAPWGAATADEYVERIRRNLRAFEEYDDLQLNYQLSAVEIESIVQRFPDIADSIKKNLELGKLKFVDGSFSQAHLQVFSSESSWRQFEMGLDIYEKHFGVRPAVYARQETGLHMQLPQILKQFGYKFALLSYFPWAIKVIGGEMELIGDDSGPATTHHDEFLNAVALDGTSIPVYAKARGCPSNGGNVGRDAIRDGYSGPPIWVTFPDLTEITEKKHTSVTRMFEFILLDDVLPERYKQAPPKADVRIYTYWSYIEGVWADELLRTTRDSERYALLAESLNVINVMRGRKTIDLHDIWHTILKYQHHDVHWIEVTDLKRKAIERTKEAKKLCMSIMEEIVSHEVEPDGNSLTLWNGLTRDRSTIFVSDALNAVEGTQEFEGKVYGQVALPSFGYKKYAKAEPCVSMKSDMPSAISNSFYTADISDSGLIRRLSTDKGDVVVDAGEVSGGEMRCMIDEQWYDTKAADLAFYRGEIADILTRSSLLNDIPVYEKYFFFKEMPVIKVEVRFDFNKNSVGYYWLDDTKINIYHPTSRGQVLHDIPFGYIDGSEGKPLFCTNWLFSSGLVHINMGNPKLCVKDGTISHMIAWGGNRFGNRMHFDAWSSKEQYDITLNGRQEIEYFLVPWGDFDGNAIVKMVDDLTNPVYVSDGRPIHEDQKSFISAKEKELLITSVFEKEGDLTARGYKLPGGIKDKFRDFEIVNIPVDQL